MEISTILGVLFELALAAFVVWGILHEDRLIAFERRIWSEFKNRKSK